jgi:hypothetical protein
MAPVLDPTRFAHPGDCDAAFCERSGRDSCIEGVHKIQNHVNDTFIADHSIDHGVVNGAVRPFDAEILLDEIGAFPGGTVGNWPRKPRQSNLGYGAFAGLIVSGWLQEESGKNLENRPNR